MAELHTAPFAEDSYNQVLSQPGLRRFYHMARFRWVKDRIGRYASGPIRLVELGCYDGRLLEVLGSNVVEYVGLDANWGGGLNAARRKHGGRSQITFIEATQPKDLDRFASGQFNAAATLETLEHVPPELVPGFLDQLRRVTRGHLFVTIPNELGPIFLAKYLAKLLLFGGGHSYSIAEVIAATTRRSDLIRREDHKGFDYRYIVQQIAARFEVIEVRGLASFGLPAALSPTIAIVAKSH